MSNSKQNDKIKAKRKNALVENKKTAKRCLVASRLCTVCGLSVVENVHETTNERFLSIVSFKV